jgi:hypothetical protein
MHSLTNVPTVPGRSLVLVDMSGSMGSSFSKDGSLQRWDAAALFGIAFAMVNPASDLVAFSSATKVFTPRTGATVLAELVSWEKEGYTMGAGTETAAALQQHFKLGKHDRVLILTDEQAASSYGASVGRSIPAEVPMYTWNLAGYKYGHAPSGIGNRHTFGGLTDQAFSMIPMIESLADGSWPWETVPEQTDR